MKKIKKVDNDKQGIKRYLSPQPSNIRNKKLRKTVETTDVHTERNEAGAYLFAHKGNTNDDEINQNKDSNSKDCHQFKAPIAVEKSIENINWNTFVQDPGEIHGLQYPVSFSTFKTTTHCSNVVKRILEDMRSATGIDFTNDELIKERVLKNFYIQFYEQPQIRDVYKLEIKACPTFVKKKIMQIPTLSDETSRDDAATKAEPGKPTKISRNKSKPLERSDNQLPVISKSVDLPAARTVELNRLEEQTSQHIDILDDIRESAKPQLLNMADKSIELECVEAQSSQSVIHCKATNDQRRQENVEVQSSKKEEIILPQQRVSPSVCIPTKKIYISKSVVFADFEFLKTHIKRRVPDGEKQQIILERIALELLQQKKHAHREYVIKKEAAVEEKSVGVEENVIDITDNKSSQATLGDLSQIERIQQAKALFFHELPKTNTLAYAQRFHKGLKRHIIAAILEMSMEEFKKYTKIYDAAEIYDDDELLETIYNNTIKSSKIWPKNLYMLLNDLREYLKTKGVNITGNNLEDISPMLLHWQELSEITNFDEIVRWDYYRCKGEIFGKNMDSFDIYRKAFYEKCWLHNNWLREVPKLINTVDNNDMKKVGITPMEVDGDADVGVESGNNETVELEHRLNAAPEVVAVDEIEEEITHETQTKEMVVNHVEESNAPLAVKSAEHSDEANFTQKEDASVMANQAENVEPVNFVNAEPIAGTSTAPIQSQDGDLTAENSSNNMLTVETTTENQHIELSDDAAKQIQTAVALDEETSRSVNQNCESNREIITQQRLQKAKELYFKEVEKPCTLAYLVRFHNGLKRRILQAILSMSFEEFKEYTHIYDAAEIYNDPDLLQRCYDYALKKPQVWPINLYIHLPNLFKYLQTKDIILNEDDLKHISPKLLHWNELTTLTNYDYIVAWDYYKCSGKKMRKNKALREPYRQKFYTKCWFYDEWLWYTPKLSTEMLCEDLLELNEIVIKEESDENTVFEQSVVVHAITESECEVVECTKGTEAHEREDSAGQEHAASSTTRNVCMVDAEIQTSQRLLATITDLQTIVPNTAVRRIPEPFPLPYKAIKEEKLEPLNKLQFNLTKDEENYECVPLPDDVVDLDISLSSAQSEQLILPLSNSETLATQDFTSLLSCESSVDKNGDKRSESLNCDLNTQQNCLTQVAHEEDVESETLARNACQNEGSTDESSLPPLEQSEIEPKTQTQPRRGSTVQEQQQQQQQVCPEVELSDVSSLQKPISRQVKQEIIEHEQKQAEETKKKPRKALQKQQSDLGTAMTRIFEANLLSQKRKQKQKQQQQQRAKKFKTAAIASKKQQQSIENDHQHEQQSIENDHQQEEQSIENKQKEKSIENDKQEEKSIENKQKEKSIENDQQEEKSIENDQQEQSIENDQQEEKSTENYQQQEQSIENDQQQKQSMESDQRQKSVKIKQQQKSMKDKQESIENKQQQKSIKNKQQSMENKQEQKPIENIQQKSIKNKQKEQSIKNKQKEQSIENKQEQPSIKNKHEQQSIKNRQQKQSIDNKQQQQSIDNKQQQQQLIDNKQQQQSIDNKQQQQSVKTKKQQKSVENTQQKLLQMSTNQSQQPQHGLIQKQQQQEENSTLQGQQKEKEINQLIDEEITKELEQNEEETLKTSFEQTEQYSTRQQQQILVEEQAIRQKQRLIKKPTLQYVQQQQQQITVQKSYKTCQKSESREQRKTCAKHKIEKQQQLSVEQEDAKLSELQHQDTQQCVQQQEKNTQSQQREQTQQTQQQQTQNKEQQKHTQQEETEDLTKWLLRVTTQYQQLQHQQQESVVQQQQTAEEEEQNQQQPPQQQQQQQMLMQQQQASPIQSQDLHEQHQQQQQQQENLFTNQHIKLQQQSQQYSQSQILLQRTSTQIQEQVVLTPAAGTLTATNLSPLNQQVNRPITTATTTTTTTKTRTVRQAKATTTTTTTIRKSAKISDYVPQLTHAFQPLPIGMNTKKMLSQPATSTTTVATTTKRAKATIETQQNELCCQQIVPANNLALTPTTTTAAAAAAAAAATTGTPPMLLTLPLPAGNANNVSGCNNSYVFTLSGDNTLFNSSELFRILEGIQLQRSQQDQQLQQQQQQQLQVQMLQLPLPRSQQEQQLQQQQQQQQQQQPLQVQLVQIPQPLQLFGRNSPQPLVFVHPDLLQQQQQPPLHLPQFQQQQQQAQLQQLQIQQLQPQLQQSQLQLLQQQQQAQLQQLQQQQVQLQQQPQLLQQQFAQLQLPEQQLMPYNQTQMLERQQQQHYEPALQISPSLALLNVDAEHQQQQQNQSYELLASTPQQQQQNQSYQLLSSTQQQQQQNQSYQLLSSTPQQQHQQQHVCQIMDAIQALRCIGNEENENSKRPQQSPEAHTPLHQNIEYGVQEVGNTNAHQHTENTQPLTNTTNDMFQVNICVEHIYSNTPIHSPNLVTPSLPSPKGLTRMCTPACLKRFFCRRLEKLDYFSEVTALNIAEYQLQCSSIGQSYLQAKLRTRQLRTLIHGDILADLLPRCTPNMIEDLHLLLQYVGEFHFDIWQQQRQRKFISKCTHRTLHTLCAHVLILFLAYSTPFQTKCLNLVEETRRFEPNNVWSTCVADVPVNKVEQSFGDLSMAIDPSILAQMAVLKRNL